MPEGNEGGLKVQLEAEVQTAPLIVTSSRSPTPARGAASTKVSLDASPHHELLRKRRPAASEAIPLSCEGHPFFEGLTGSGIL